MGKEANFRKSFFSDITFERIGFWVCLEGGASRLFVPRPGEGGREGREGGGEEGKEGEGGTDRFLLGLSGVGKKQPGGGGSATSRGARTGEMK